MPPDKIKVQHGTMMKYAVLVVLGLVHSSVAAPAMVWKKGQQGTATQHTSDDLRASELIADALNAEFDDAALAGVVFLIGRGSDGSESLSSLASQGSLPGVQSKYDSADLVHHHVSGIESYHSMVRDTSKVLPSRNVLQVSLSEFSSKLVGMNEQVEVEITGNGMMSKAAKAAGKRARALAAADVLVVRCDAGTDPAAIDSAVVNAIESESVGRVVLAGIRSTVEVKAERDMEQRRRLEKMVNAGNRIQTSKGRRLEDQQDQDNQGQDNGDNDDVSGIYYVYMTPNIFAGLLFFFLFSFVTYIGISCMGMIKGQDVYVSKMPAIGREA